MLLKKIMAILFFGVVLAAFNFFGGTALAILCFGKVGYVPDLLPHSLVLIVVPLFFLNLVALTPAIAFTIVGKAFNNDKPLAWCMKNWWSFLLAFALPFIIFSIMIFGGANMA